MPEAATKADKIQAWIGALDAQRAALGDAVVEPALTALRQQLSDLAAAAEKRTREDERKIVTVVFADISGSTALSEKKDPQEVRALMNACFESLVSIVQKYEGTIEKFIGDESMALFGAPVAHEGGPERAAQEMIDAIAAVNQKHRHRAGLAWQINLILLMLPLKQRWGSGGALEVLLQCCTGRSSAGTGLALPRRAGHRSLSIEGNAITTYIIR
jgi:predicted trehalose synthase